MNSAIATLSLLASMDATEITIFENYIPLIKYIAITQNMTYYDEDIFHKQFIEEFKLDLPSYVLQYILTKSLNRGLLKKDRGKYRFTDKTLSDAHVVATIQGHRREFNANIVELVSMFNEFSKNFDDYNRIFSIEDFERLIYTNTESTYNHAYRGRILPEKGVKNTNTVVEDNYVYSMFTEHLFQNDATRFNCIINISFGYSVSELLFCPEFDNNVSFKNLNCFFDTRFILYLLGAEGEYYYESSNKLITALHQTGAKLQIFTHTYEEVQQILQSCIRHWYDYNPSIAPSALVYFKRKRKPKTDLEVILHSVSRRLEQHNIDIVEPKYSSDYDGIHDEITEWLINNRRPGVYFRFDRNSAERDARSIISVLIDRNNSKPVLLKNAKSIFITSSITLIECLTKLNFVEDCHIAPCHSDMFIGSLMWLLNRNKYDKINKTHFAAVASSLSTLNKSLFDNFVLKFKDVCSQDDIDEELVQSFIQDRTLHDILQNHTLNNTDRITTENVRKIKEEYISQLREEEEKNTQKAISERDDYRDKYQKNEATLDSIKEFRQQKEANCRASATQRTKWIIISIKFIAYSLDIAISWLIGYCLNHSLGRFAYLIAIAVLLVIGWLVKIINWKVLAVKIRRIIIEKMIKHLDNTTIPQELLN